MSQFPSPADSASSSSGSGFQTSPTSTPKLYGTADPEEDDILVALGAPPPRAKRPPRPPPPRSQSLPHNIVPDKASSNTATQSLPSSHPQYSTGNAAESGLYTPLPLHPHEIRWLYQERGKYWQPFNGHDSLALEECYRRVHSCQDQGATANCDIVVLGDMYEVNIVELTCKPIYWAGWLVYTECNSMDH